MFIEAYTLLTRCGLSLQIEGHNPPSSPISYASGYIGLPRMFLSINSKCI